METDAMTTDRETLTKVAYANSRALRARAGIYDFEREPMHLPTWVASHVPVRPGAHVLEVGCGPAPYLQHFSSTAGVVPIGCDLSHGMASEARATLGRATVVVGDVQALPFESKSFDVVLAPHMLYHVADIASAASELARVARERVAIVTNARGHTEELFQLLLASTRDVVGPAVSLRARTFERFTFEDAPTVLSGALEVEQTMSAAGVIEVPVAEPVVDYLASMRALYLRDIPDARWTDVLEAARARVEDVIAEQGSWTTHKHVGLLLCRPASPQTR
jgi:ubiquinone/menaquinone biosynthesis C-methylase UbiE